MKKTLLLAGVILIAVCNCFSQSAEKNTLLQKSKNQKTAAWILAGAGAGTLILGLTKINVAGSDTKTVINTT